VDSIEHTENTAAKQRGRPFEPGKSGNPNGRPKGSRNQATMLAEALLDGEAEAITRKLINTALEGDTTALRLCLERLLAPRRERRVAFEFPEIIETAADAVRASSMVLGECAAGNLSPSEASEIMGLISSHVRVLEVTEIESRLAALENKTKS
jgi:Family of unknown function (DUF5681)